MGILSFLFATTMMFVWGMEVIIGDRKDDANTFYWDLVSRDKRKLAREGSFSLHR